jgi:hypothetical protein
MNINGLNAEELLLVGVQPSKDQPRYGFSLFINEMTSSYKTPNFILNLNNESNPPTSSSKEEIIAFWDEIVRTIRLRPGAFK